MTTPPKPPGPVDAQRALLLESKIRIACAETLEIYDDGWYCSRCRTSVPPQNVTFEETHDIRIGGCGERVSGDGNPDFLHDANAALLLVEGAKQQGCSFELNTIGCWGCCFSRDESAYEGRADTFCAAVCEAWLRLCGKWEEVTSEPPAAP
jgi:hypothetical protein